MSTIIGLLHNIIENSEMSSYFKRLGKIQRNSIRPMFD